MQDVAEGKPLLATKRLTYMLKTKLISNSRSICKYNNNDVKWDSINLRIINT